MKAVPLLLGLIAFGLSLAGSFQFDDHALFSDPAITSPGGWLEVWSWKQTRPLTWFSFWLSFQLSGADPVPWHALSLMLHLGCAWLTYSTLRRVIPENAAILAACVFAVHPLQAQAVNYVFARATLLMTLFCLLAFRSWLNGKQWHAAGWFFLALLSKEECAAFPLFLGAWEWTRTRRLPAMPLAAMLAVTLAAGARAVWATQAIPGSGSGFTAGIAPLDYFFTQGFQIPRYAALLIWPHPLTVDPDVTVRGALPGLLAWVLVIVATIMLYRRGGEFGFWISAAVLLLLPSSSILPAADLAADRRLYLPMLGFAAALGSALNRAPRAVLAVLLVWTSLSVRQTLLWRSEESLWTEALLHAPGKIRPRIQLARVLPPERGLVLIQQAKKIDPANPLLASEEGRIHLESNRPDLALEAFGQALALEPESARAINNRAVAMAALGQMETARAEWVRALDKDPCLFDARLNLRKAGSPAPPLDSCRFTPDQAKALGL
ncbi:MAG: tetratricopeptide repeat protein [Bryobacteraceae bacterium]|nr:tetratricopeptide repeat protein [Bryobacteraceae bacterium]